MRVAVIGSGGREHAIVKKLKQSKRCKEIVAIPGNGGMAQECTCMAINPTDIAAVTQYCVENNVDYVVVTPDDPLAQGMVDALDSCGIAAFGPSQAAARIESSKIFAKNLMKKYNIPTPGYQCFADGSNALAYIAKNTAYPVVVKADGLALGKGVLICQNENEAKNAINFMMKDKIFGEAGTSIVIEEFIEGPEVSVLAFCDGKTVVPMVSSMDHKRALDEDKGKNTGGMGAVAPNPCYTKEMAQRCMAEIFLPTVRAMQQEGAPFSGCLYFGLMLTQNGPRVIEYNARFGDPEAQVILPLLQDDLLEIMLACTNGCLTSEMVHFSDDAAACVVMASGGYPDAYKTGLAISGIAAAERECDVAVYQAGTRQVPEGVVTAGGRVLAVTATAPSLQAALQKAYRGVEAIDFENAHFRRDIGAKALENDN